jgi:SnoaL-like domain
MAELPINDVIELQQVLAKYSVAMTQNDVERVMGEVFAPGGTYSAFGATYTLADFPALVEAAPKGLFLTGTPALDLDVEAGTGTGEQPLLFIDQTNHHMRMGWYSDTYVRTEAGWRLKTRSMTFLRRHGGADHGKAHDPLRPAPATNPAI